VSASSTVHRHTPVLQVHDARGLPVRQVEYCRGVAGQAAQRRLRLTRHDPPGQSLRRWDPRQSEHLGQGRSPGASHGELRSLSARTLLDESADAGWQLLLVADAGQVVEHWDSRGSHWQTEHDPRLRPVLIREGTGQQPARVSQRFTYADVGGANRRGRLVRHDDDAGTRRVTGYSLTGQESDETRHFLVDLELPDWPEPLAQRDALLEPGDGASSRFVHGPLLQVIEQQDALGNRLGYRLDAAGQLSAVTLVLPDGTEQALLSEIRYNALGQIDAQTAGNGVVSQCQHDPASGRLSRLNSRWPGRAALQALVYHYDPVGNVLKIEDHSQPASHFANQRVEPVATYTYDSLYQLHQATGREAAGAVLGPGLPELVANPGDTSRLLNYRQQYRYDASGNLSSLSHVGAQQSYTRTLNVAEHSNHAVPEPGDPLAAFDRNGNLLELGPGQPLQWNRRNQLHSCRQVSRENGPNDEEQYRYSAAGLRVRKVVSRLVGGRLQHSETRYLPGLELHVRAQQCFAVISTQAGHCAVRCLHWSSGAPEGLDNPQLRYSLRDPHDSSGLELDGAARIISHEGWYPFGGTAWWAGHSALEASYKARRHSGKERDSSGLYDYGLRYYAPWLARWINPDPAGPVDGLNLFRAMRNNPVTLKDGNGLNPTPAESAEDQARALARNPGILALPQRELPYTDPFKQRFEFVVADLAEHYRIYLDKSGPADNLIITAHGGYYPWSRDVRIPERTTVGFYNPHGTTLADPGIGNAAHGSNKVFVLMSGKDFLPRKQEALASLQQGDIARLSGSDKDFFIRDYSLSKYETDDDPTIAAAMSINRAQGHGFKFDVLTVRNRKALPALFQSPSLRGVFSALKRQGIHYSAIYCLTCRGGIFAKPANYDPRQARDT